MEEANYEDNWRNTTAHEIGHHFGLEHENGWLMADGSTLHLPQHRQFHLNDLDKLRRSNGPVPVPNL